MAEQFFSDFPVKLDPTFSVAYILLLAYVPHLLKRGFVNKKLKAIGKQNSIATSRVSTQHAIDFSKEGLFIASLVGCHQNGLEAFSYYAAAIALALIAKVPTAVVSGAAGLFMIIRIIYSFVYCSPLNGAPRFFVWSLGVATCASLIFIASAYQKKVF